MAIDKCNLRKIIVTSMSFATVVFGVLFFLLGVVSFGLGGSYSIIDTFRIFGDFGLFFEEIMNLVKSIASGADALNSVFAFLAEFAYQIISIVYFIIMLVRIIKAIIVYSRVWSTKDWDNAEVSLGKSARGMILSLLAYVSVAFFLVGGYEWVSLSGAGVTFVVWVCIYYIGKNVLGNVLSCEGKAIVPTIVSAAYEAVKLVLIILAINFIFGYPVYKEFISAFFNLIYMFTGNAMDVLVDKVLPHLSGIFVLIAFGFVKKGLVNNMDGNDEKAKSNALMAMIFGLVALTFDVIFSYAIPSALVWEYQSAFIGMAVVLVLNFGAYFLSLVVALFDKKEAAPAVEEAPAEAELAPAEEAAAEEVSENN